MCYPNGYSSSKEKGLRLMLELKYICNYTHYRSLSLMHKCSSPLVQEHICSPHLRLHFPLSLYLGSQAPSTLWFLYLFRDLPDHCGSWSLWNKGWVFLSVWFREEADYYQSMSLPHVFLPSRTCSCRSMWLCFREPQGHGHYRHHPFFPPFSCWRSVILHWLGQYPHQNPGSSQGTWVRRL